MAVASPPSAETAGAVRLPGGPEFEPAALELYLRAALDIASGGFALERVSGGQSNPTFFVTLGPRRLVLRKKPAGDVLPSAHAVDREFRVITALAQTNVPVPHDMALQAVADADSYSKHDVEGKMLDALARKAFRRDPSYAT